MSEENQSISQDLNEEKLSDQDTSQIELAANSTLEEKISNSEKLDFQEVKEVVEELYELKNIIVQQTFVSPLPPPAILKEYEDILKGSADRLFSMVETQANHRMSIEKTIIKGDIWRSFTGLGAGFIIAIFGLGGAFFLGLQDKTVASGFMSIGGLSGLVSVFVMQNNNKEESNSKEEELDS